MKNSTKKSLLISMYLDRDYNMSTRDIIERIKNEWSVDVSRRHVQRTRKEYKKNKRKGNKMTTHLTEQQLNVINSINENVGWTVQELALEYGMEEFEIRQLINKFKWMIKSRVIDNCNISKNNRNLNVEDDIWNNEADDDVIELTDVVTKGNITHKQTQNEDDYWEVEMEMVHSCSKVQSDVNVLIEKNTKRKIKLFMQWAGSREWLGYLIGKFKDDSYTITDIFLPDQRTSAALVDKVEAVNYNQFKVVGVIHSHHDMGAGDENNPSFSSHDESFINGNHNLSLLAGRDRKTKGFKIVGIARVKTPCGSLMTVKANVKYAKDGLSEEEQSLKNEFFKKTQTKTHVVRTYRAGQNGFGYVNGANCRHTQSQSPLS